MKKTNKRVSLRSETIRSMTVGDLRADGAGGGSALTCRQCKPPGAQEGGCCSVQALRADEQ